MNELKIEYLPPEQLTPYENNTRKHSPDDIEGIKKSILDVGFDDPIGVWGEKNIIVEGHGRQIAALELGLEKVPVIHLDHLTDAQRREYAIRHNRSAEMSMWNFDALQEEIAALEIEGVDLSDLNFELNNEDLFNFMNNDSFVDRGVSAETFNMSFEFDIKYKEAIDDYVKENTKSPLIDAILEVVENA